MNVWEADACEKMSFSLNANKANVGAMHCRSWLLLAVAILIACIAPTGADYTCSCPATAINPDGTTSSLGIHSVHDCEDQTKFLAPVDGV